jgi:hypothetical protein
MAERRPTPKRHAASDNGSRAADDDSERPTRERQRSGDDRPRRPAKPDAQGRSADERAPRKLSPGRVAREAAQQLMALIDRPVTGIIAFERTDEGFTVQVEVVELERVPDTMTILACYEVRLDDHGDLVGYRRIARYPRSRVDEG